MGINTHGWRLTVCVRLAAQDFRYGVSFNLHSNSVWFMLSLSHLMDEALGLRAVICLVGKWWH